MLVLGIETSCDDTAAGVVRDGAEVLSSVVSSQDNVHGQFGGVVPEIASRGHLENIVGVVHRALEGAACSIGDMDLISVTAGPGLIGSLLVGLSFAKGAAFLTGLPLVPVDHVQGHLATLDLAGGTPYPSVALVVSGGHTTLFHMSSPDDIGIIGTTLDDAAGEALDKAAKMLGLGYPGGPAIETASRDGDPASLQLPRPLSGTDRLEFSFSGLKTALFTYLGRHGYLDTTGEGRARLPLSTSDLAASFQQAVIDVLVEKCIGAVRLHRVNHLIVVGGVARNAALRERMSRVGVESGFEVHFPPPSYCTDNAAMIAALGFRKRAEAGTEIMDINAYSTKALKRGKGPGNRD
ncbi:MAG: tRNA (adenosine(37)-N6)-threonylcarbamoyltransferase complex transferase subunit TsaD [bacterium]|nr:MAG: tRNA (adenosine(37)-N6)-threonylcarbamoyltransferase complex transferase subunit TsaD [bacterium]